MVFSIHTCTFGGLQNPCCESKKPKNNPKPPPASLAAIVTVSSFPLARTIPFHQKSTLASFLHFPLQPLWRGTVDSYEWVVAITIRAGAYDTNDRLCSDLANGMCPDFKTRHPDHKSH